MARMIGGLAPMMIGALMFVVAGVVPAATAANQVDAGCTPTHPHFIPTRALDTETAPYTDDLVICANSPLDSDQTALSVRNRTDLVWTVAAPPYSTLTATRGSVKSNVFHEGMAGSTGATFIVPGERVSYAGGAGTFTDIYNRLFLSPEPTLNLAWVGWSTLADAAASKTRSIGKAAFASGSLTRVALWDCAAASFDAARTVLKTTDSGEAVDPATFADTLTTSLGFASGASTCAASWEEAADDLSGVKASRWNGVATRLERTTAFASRVVAKVEGYNVLRSVLCIIPRVPC